MNAYHWARAVLALALGGLLAGGCGSGVNEFSSTGSTNEGAPAARLEEPQASTVALLSPGWNSVAFEFPTVTSINATSAAGLAFYDGTAYQIGNLDLATINGGAGTRRGFWVFATGQGQIEYGGERGLQPPSSVDLRAGWNLVAFPGPEIPGSNLKVSQGGSFVPLTSVLLPQFTELNNIDPPPPAPTDAQKKGEVAGQTVLTSTVDVSAGGILKPRKAYWVFAASACTLLPGGGTSPSPGSSPLPGSSPVATPAASPTSPSPTPAPGDVSVIINTNNVTSIPVGGLILASSHALINGSVANVSSATFSSSNPNIVRVTNHGSGATSGCNIIGVSPGTAQVQAVAVVSNASGMVIGTVTGYVNITVTNNSSPSPTPTPTPSTLSLNLWYSVGWGDHFSTASAQGNADAPNFGFYFVRSEGRVFASQVPGTVPLKLYFDNSRLDNFTLSTAAALSDAANALPTPYSFVRTEGFVYPTQQPGTVPLKLYFNASRGDNFTTATAAGEADAINQGYTFIRVEGYCLP